MQALNFSSRMSVGYLLRRQKSCTIRLGDKTDKYREGEIVSILVGEKYAKKKRLFDAVIDRILVKPIFSLTTGDMRGENPECHSANDFVRWLQDLSEREIVAEDMVTVIYFSEIAE